MSASPTHPPLLRVLTLGHAQVEVGGAAAVWGARSAEELFWYLHAHPEGAARSRILSELWGQDESAAAANRFRVALFRVRNALGQPEVVAEHGRRFALSRDVFDASDTAPLERAILALSQPQDAAHSQQIEQLQEVLRGCQGVYLPHIQEPWVQAERERWGGLQVALQLRLSRLHCLERQCVESACNLRAALTSDPYQPENLHQRLMGCLNVTESKYTAIEYYRRYRRFLSEEVGDTPMPETVELAEAIKVGEHCCQEGDTGHLPKG